VNRKTKKSYEKTRNGMTKLDCLREKERGILVKEHQPRKSEGKKKSERKNENSKAVTNVSAFVVCSELVTLRVINLDKETLSYAVNLLL